MRFTVLFQAVALGFISLSFSSPLDIRDVASSATAMAAIQEAYIQDCNSDAACITAWYACQIQLFFHLLINADKLQYCDCRSKLYRLCKSKAGFGILRRCCQRHGRRLRRCMSCESKWNARYEVRYGMVGFTRWHIIWMIIENFPVPQLLLRAWQLAHDLYSLLNGEE